MQNYLVGKELQFYQNGMIAVCKDAKMYPYSKFGIPLSNNIRDMLLTRLFKKLGQDHKTDPQHCHHKMQPHTKFEIPSSNNIEKSSEYDVSKN